MGFLNNKNKIKKPVSGKVAKVPSLLQMEALECGAACLTMIMAYYGKWIPLERVREDCGVSRDGSNAKNILIAARKYGFKASGYRYELDSIRTEAEFPAIIFWEFNHFVVLCGFKGDYAIINDPARGRVKLTMDKFDKGFTGVALLFEPTENFEPSGKKKSVLSYAGKSLRGTGVAFAFVVFTTLIGCLFNVINPVFGRVFADRLLTGKNPSWLIPFVVIMVLAGFLELLAAWLQAIYSLKIDGRISASGNSRYMWKVLRLPMHFFSQRMAGDIQGRMMLIASNADQIVNTLAPLILQAVMMVFYLVVMINYSVPLTCVGLFSILINIFISMYISKKQTEIMAVQIRDSAKLSSTTLYGIKMIETVKAAGAENGYFEKWSGYQASVNNQEVSVNKLISYVGIVPEIVNLLSSTLISIMGVYYVMRGSFTVGMILAFQGFLASFTQPVNSFINAATSIVTMRNDMDRVEDVMEYPIDEMDEIMYEDASSDDKMEEKEYRKLTGEVELKNITFGYSRLSPPLIVDFNMKLKPGSKVAIVGASGSGKSTVAKLIAGLYKAWEGEIYFDGIPIKEVDRNVLKGSLAVADQDIILFEDTIANNIKMWDDSIEDFEMIMAARDSSIHDAIMSRKNGYDHKLTENGRNLSGGQRQRLEIARILAQDPTIVILDEATSALDAKTEFEVIKSIKDRGVTCIVVAHRLSTIRDCDEIIVLDHGRVAERGTHEELFAKGGIYKELIVSN
ncbi:MAG: NHLP family bacteriocin export ABC transporter peptidase/permease/ATPase subunit [Lachnospiraceae bacterium]|nr:NHLP family bacteriocin export ABC transporter peptidase/permease/ATPase subunit [Lachnospiraceae bacterium]